MKKIILGLILTISLIAGLITVGEFLSCPYYNPCRKYSARLTLFGFLNGALVFYYVGYLVGKNNTK